MKILPDYALRNVLPLAVLALFLPMLAAWYQGTVASAREQLVQRARDELRREALRLAVQAGRDLAQRPQAVADDVALAGTDPRVAALALVDAAGVVVAAPQAGQVGLPARQVLRHFEPGALQGAIAEAAAAAPWGAPEPSGARVRTPAPDVWVAQAPYLVRADAPDRPDRVGSVYLEYDLRAELDRMRWQARQRAVLPALAALGFAMLLAWWLHWRVTRVLRRVERASARLAGGADQPEVLQESGPRELVRLVQSFNAMAQRIGQAQRELEAGRARLAGIFDAAMDAIITVDRDYRIRVINRAALRMFGGREDDLLGVPIGALLPTQAAPSPSGFMELLYGAEAQPAGGHVLMTGRRLDGETFPAEAAFSCTDIDGERWFTVMLRDVTDRTRTEASIIALNSNLEQQVEQRTARLQDTAQMLEAQRRTLQAAHAEQRTILETLTVGIAVHKDGVILRSNRKLEEIFGYGPQEMVRLPTRSWYPDAQCYAEAEASVAQVVAWGQVYQTDMELVRADGARFWARMTASQLADANLGMAVLVVIEDMSLQHEAEQAIREASARAQEASRAKSNFLANMSHEIRTPMNAIIGLSYQVLKSNLGPQQREQVRKIQRAGQLLLGVVNDVLDYSKIEAGKLQVEHIRFSLSTVLENVASVMSDKAAAKDLMLHFVVDPEVPAQLVGDPLRLGQILVNYTDNAIKFTAQGSVTLYISLDGHNETEVLLRGSVTDTGRGLTGAQQAALFQSFQQADSSITREFGGTGLGLVICKQLAGLMDGEVGVESTLGVGSTFWFTARLGVDAQHAAEQAQARALAPAPPGLEWLQTAGLHLEQGLRKADGDFAAYEERLRAFMLGQTDVVTDLRAALYTANRHEARHIARALKGAAARIGALAVQRSAAVLESAIRAEQSLQMLEVSVGDLARTLTPLLGHLRQCLAEKLHIPTAPDAPPDPAQMYSVCRRLALLLSQDNLEAVDWFAENAALFRHVFGAEYEAMDIQVRSFNCQRAYALLRSAAAARSMELLAQGEET